MGFLNSLAWLVFGGMAAKDAVDNQKYISESKQRMEDDDRLFYCDSRGRMYYKHTGEEIMQSYRDGRKVYINVRTGAVVCDLSSADHQRYLREWSKKYRHMEIKVDKGDQWCEFDFKEWRYYGLDKKYHLKPYTYETESIDYLRCYYKEDENHRLVKDGDWFEISKDEYHELGGRTCGPRIYSQTAMKYTTRTTKKK